MGTPPTLEARAILSPCQVCFAYHLATSSLDDMVAPSSGFAYFREKLLMTYFIINAASLDFWEDPYVGRKLH